MPPTQPSPENTPKVKWPMARRVLLLLSVAVMAIVVFYQVENWRGRRAWENCRRDLAAKGETVDWESFVPPPLPDASNSLKAPMMKDWFVRELMAPWSSSSPSPIASQQTRPATPLTLAQIKILPPSDITNANFGDADIILRFFSPGPAFFPVTNSITSTNDEVIETVAFDQVSLIDGIMTLALQAGLNIIFDPSVSDGSPLNMKLTKVTGLECLLAILNSEGLRMVDMPGTPIKRIEKKPEGSWKTFMPEATRAALRNLRDRSLGMTLATPVGEVVAQHQMDESHVARIVLICDKPPSVGEFDSFFHDYLVRPNDYLYGICQVTSTASNCFTVIRNNAYAAADYLEWSDSFESNLDLIREALRRPSAQLDDYQGKMKVGINFVTMRILSQTLAAQSLCHLLLGHPDKALERLTLIHDVNRLLDARPVTLIQSMIKVAITGLYGANIEEGLRLRAWREPELAALEKQLGEINLPADLAASLRTERAQACHLIEQLSYADFEKYKPISTLVTGGPSKPGASQTASMFQIALDKIKGYFLSIQPTARKWIGTGIFEMMPSGWRLQNMARVAMIEQPGIDGIDPVNGLVFPKQAALSTSAVEKATANSSPYNWLSSLWFANYNRVLLTTSRNQTIVNQTRVVCALERYRLANGQYPAALAALVPRFIDRLPHDIIGGQPMRYRRTDAGNFLLYSIGWSEKDNGGVAGTSYSDTNGDWVWGEEW